MKQIIKILFFGCSALALGACTAEDGMEDTHCSQTEKTVSFRVRSHGTGNQINQDDTHKEDFVESLVLAGTATGVFKQATATFDINSFIGKKNLSFAANLKPEDQAKVMGSANEAAFNNLLLNTEDYLRGYGTTPQLLPLVMTTTLKDVQVVGDNLSINQVRLKRVFAKLNYDFTTGSLGGLDIQEIKLENVPAKFTLAAPIEHYDLKHAADNVAYPYLSYLITNKKGVLYLPEHFVSQPAFLSPESEGMTHFVIKYQKDSEMRTLKLRIGGTKAYTGSYGQIQRNKELGIWYVKDPLIDIWIN